MAGKDKRPAKQGRQGVFLLPGIYNETLALLAQAHRYFSRQAMHEHGDMAERERVMLTSEMSRITLRLSCVMAWLMARKAAFDGAISPEDAQAHYRLDCREVCMHQHIEAESMIPEALGELLEKSLDLYERVARLDALSGQE